MLFGCILLPYENGYSFGCSYPYLSISVLRYTVNVVCWKATITHLIVKKNGAIIGRVVQCPIVIKCDYPLTLREHYPLVA